MKYLVQGNGIEKIESKHSSTALLASRHGTEIIHHRLKKGFNWSLVPEEGWEELEFVYVLSGTLECRSDGVKIILKSGDAISCEPVRKHIMFTANTDVHFLYISSKPVFHQYGSVIEQMVQVALALEQDSTETVSHCERVNSLAMRIGERLKLPTPDLLAVHYGAFFHDVGKSRIPQAILNKPGKLSSEEWELVKQHPLHGRDILVETGLQHLMDASVIVEQHHERYDGTGYPYGLKGEAIHFGAAIVAVADSFISMTSQRVYAAAKSSSQALEEIIEAQGTRYHPDVVLAFAAIMEVKLKQ